MSEPRHVCDIRHLRAHRSRRSSDRCPETLEAAAPPPSAAAVIGEVITGAVGSPGVATGRARIVHDPAHCADLQPGEILVCPITDPAWTPLFIPAAAVVVNVGALLSHAVVISRELKIPCVAAVRNATQRLIDGMLITVNGNNGTVTIIETT
jgi:rifampicin phosphotransferase